MRHKRQTFLKKQPRQGRAKATVEAILEAATHILVLEGGDRFNTNRIAEKAGVSIASLYQYFADKEAILGELRQRHVDKTRANAVQIGERYKEEGLKVLVSRIIESGIAAHTTDPDLHRIFSRLPLETQADDHGSSSDTYHLKDLKEALKSHGIAAGDADFSVWLFRTIVHAAIHEGVYCRHEDIVSGRLSKALNAMVSGWLEKTLGSTGFEEKQL